MDKHISSEEKLLKVIRKKDGKSKKKRKRIRDRFGGKTNGDQNPLQIVNNILVIISVIFIAYLVFQNSFSEKKRVEDLLSKSNNNTGEFVLEVKPAFERRPFDQYEEIFEKRDIFNISGQKQGQAAILLPPPPVEVNPLANLRLIGIVLDEEPQAIIEDSSIQQTFFLKKGQRIQEMVVEDIQETKVIFLIDDQRYELIQK